MPTYKIGKLKTGEPIVANPNGKTEWEGKEFHLWPPDPEQTFEFPSDGDAIAYGKRHVPEDKDGGGMFTVEIFKDGKFVPVEGSDTGEKGRFSCE